MTTTYLGSSSLVRPGEDAGISAQAGMGAVCYGARLWLGRLAWVLQIARGCSS